MGGPASASAFTCSRSSKLKHVGLGVSSRCAEAYEHEPSAKVKIFVDPVCAGEREWEGEQRTVRFRIFRVFLQSRTTRRSRANSTIDRKTQKSDRTISIETSRVYECGGFSPEVDRGEVEVDVRHRKWIESRNNQPRRRTRKETGRDQRVNLHRGN